MKNPRAIYIAGPMTGLVDFNYPAFQQAEQVLFALGAAPVSPHHIGQHDGWSHDDYMREALHLMIGCTGVALLPGWQNSEGANIERKVAQEIPWLKEHVFTLVEWTDVLLHQPKREAPPSLLLPADQIPGAC